MISLISKALLIIFFKPEICHFFFNIKTFFKRKSFRNQYKRLVLKRSTFQTKDQSKRKMGKTKDPDVSRFDRFRLFLLILGEIFETDFLPQI